MIVYLDHRFVPVCLYTAEHFELIEVPIILIEFILERGAVRATNSVTHEFFPQARKSRENVYAMTSSSYHLWLKPSGSAYELFAKTIRELACELNAPVFEPHVTLLGHLTGTEHEHVRRTNQLARRLHPFRIILIEPSHRNEYFQCLFMSVERTPAVMNANTLAKHVFCREEEAYMPHLSLVYGLYPETRKREVLANLRPDVRTWFEVSAVYLIKAHSRDPKDWWEILASPMRQ